jgi:hypothetical protein
VNLEDSSSSERTATSPGVLAKQAELTLSYEAWRIFGYIYSGYRVREAKYISDFLASTKN